MKNPAISVSMRFVCCILLISVMSPYQRYVGIHSPQKNRQPLSTDQDHTFQLVSVDYHGAPIAGSELDISIYKLDWYWWWSADQSTLANFTSSSYYKPVKQEKLTTDEAGKASLALSFDEKNWGTYLILAKDRKSGHTTGVVSYFDWPNINIFLVQMPHPCWSLS